MPRLFVALRPPPEIRASLCALMSGVSGARWQSDAQLHLTVRYIGEIDHRMMEDVAAVLARVPARPIVAQVAGVGAFARRERVHTLWAGIAPHEPIDRLHLKVERALVELGLAPEPRVFMPHITVARLALGANMAAETAQWQHRHAEFASTAFIFTHLSLYDSHLAAGGADYREIARWQLHD